MARMDRFELMGLLGIASMFMGRRKKKKMKRLADTLGSAVSIYDDSRVLLKRLEVVAADPDKTLTTSEQEELADLIGVTTELVDAARAF